MEIYDLDSFIDINVERKNINELVKKKNKEYLNMFSKIKLNFSFNYSEMYTELSERLRGTNKFVENYLITLYKIVSNKISYKELYSINYIDYNTLELNLYFEVLDKMVKELLINLSKYDDSKLNYNDVKRRAKEKLNEINN